VQSRPAVEKIIYVAVWKCHDTTPCSKKDNTNRGVGLPHTPQCGGGMCSTECRLVTASRCECKVLRSACLYVYLFVCLSARISQKPHVQISRNILYLLPMAVALSSSDGSEIRYVLPVLWMTSCIHIRE